MCKSAPLFGPERGVATVAKIRALLNPDQPLAAPQKEVISQLYSILTVLDSKANGLLRVNSLFLTILVAYLTWMRTVGASSDLQAYQWIAYVDLVPIILSSFLCLLIMKVKWKFLGQVEPDGAGYKFEKEIRELGNVVDDRTHYYWMAWWGTTIGLLLPVVAGVVVQLHSRMQ